MLNASHPRTLVNQIVLVHWCHSSHHSHHQLPAFSKTAPITYFQAPGHTGKVMGNAMLERLLSEARQKGIAISLAGISSFHPGSIAFHQKNGFVPWGRFVGIGYKWRQGFDEVWMSRTI